MKNFGKTVACMLLGLMVAASPALAEKRQGGTVNMVVRTSDAHVRNFNPYNFAVGIYQARDFVYEPMYIFNVKHPDKDFPWLATDYKYSDDLTVLTVTLREGVKWSDGEAFDADDVLFTFNLKKEHPEVNIGPFWDGEDSKGMLTGIEKTGQYEVKFNLAQADSLAHIQILAVYILPEHVWKDIEDPLNFPNENPVATGAFTEVVDFKTTVYTLGKNPHYWQEGKPYVDFIRFPQFSSNEQVLAAAAHGDIDWFGTGLTDVEKMYTSKNPDSKLWLTAGGVVKLLPNTTKAPFNNKEFRKAMSVAINRKDLLEIATFGLTLPAPYPGGIGLMYEAWLDHERMKEYASLMEYDAEKAKSMLDEAGFVDKDGDGWRDNPDGTPISFQISVPTGWTDWVNSVMMVAENFQDIGINAEMYTPEEGAWWEAMGTGEYDMYIMWGIGSPTPREPYNQMFNPDYISKKHSVALHLMEMPAVMELLDKFSATTDLAEQKDLLGQVQQLVAEEMPFISLFSNPIWYQYNVSRFEGWANEENPFIRPAIHGGYPERAVHLLNLSLKEGVEAE